MKQYEIESVEGIGYLIFEKLNSRQTRRVGGVYQNLQQVKSYLGAKASQFIKVNTPAAYDEMINNA